MTEYLSKTMGSQNQYEDLATILANTLSYSRDRNYIGYDKHDGMSSRIRESLPFENKWVNLCFQESSKRSPINLRPFLFVEQRPNPKGLSLFLMANYATYKLTGKQEYIDEAKELAQRLVKHSSDNYAGFAIGHKHELQGLHGKTTAGVPGIVQTSYGVKALLRLSRDVEKYTHTAVDGARFLEQELNPEETDAGLRVKYNPTDSSESYTLNANAVAARMLVDLYAHCGKKEYRQMATDILRYVSNHQEDIGGWKYTDPPSASHLSMDNYHNGFIIESFLRYQSVVDSGAFEDTVERSLEFYRQVLYEKNGAPCWDETNTYPHDIHAVAQGILVFTYAGDLEFARKIIEWAIDELYAGDGQFYYQRTKYYTKRFTLMRWCQAWMAYALSEFVRHRDEKPL